MGKRGPHAGISAVERFWRFVRKSDGCWEWTGVLNYKGYGQFRPIRSRIVTTHRFAWEITVGPVPAGLFVCHRCDNRRCVRPDHLFLGTHEDNMRDMVQKGRSSTVRQKPTHCPSGHPRAPENLCWNGNHFSCRLCRNERARRYRAAAPKRKDPETICAARGVMDRDGAGRSDPTAAEQPAGDLQSTSILVGA